MLFDNHRIPRENLLDRTGTVTPDGRYILKINNPLERYTIPLQSITTSRLGVIAFSAESLAKALTIAVRYAAVRKQFGSDEEQELPILEYQLVVNYFYTQSIF